MQDALVAICHSNTKFRSDCAEASGTHFMPPGLEPSTAQSRPEKVVLRGTSDVDRLIAYLLSHIKPPRIEVCMDKISDLESARAQHDLRLYSEKCNCLLGEVTGGLTFLIGGYHAWLSARGDWPNLLPVVTATACIALLGKAIEVGWSRYRMICVLRYLRGRLSGSIAAPAIANPPLPVSEIRSRAGRSPEPGMSVRIATSPKRESGPKAYPKIPLSSTRDVDRLIIHLATHWPLPRAEVQAQDLPALTAQRAQTRLTRVSSGYSYLPAAVLALLGFLGGFGLLMQPPDDPVLWRMRPEGSSILSVFAVTLCGGAFGLLAEASWKRVQLLRVLLALRRHLPKA
jgi:hypothetical protein